MQMSLTARYPECMIYSFGGVSLVPMCECFGLVTMSLKELVIVPTAVCDHVLVTD